MGKQHRTRQRRRTAAAANAADAADAAAPSAPPSSGDPAPKAERRAPRRRAGGELHDLAGTGHSQLGPVGALRGRDVNRPTDDDLAEAERELTIVRRHWTP